MAARGKRGGSPGAPVRAARSVSIKTRWGARALLLPEMPVETAPTCSTVLALHGGNGTAQGFVLRSGLAEALQSYGHDIAFPQALRHWSDGRPPLEDRWPGDRGFIEVIHARQKEALNRAEVPLALIGVSNGGMFCQRLCCALSEPPAIGVAVVSALPEALAQSAPPGPPVPMMLIQATDDPLIPWEGGEVPDIAGFSVAGRLLGVEATVDFWKRRNRITAPPRRSRARVGRHDARISFWDGGAAGADLWLVVLEGAGHRQLDGDPRHFRTGTLQDLIARTVMWYVDRDRLAATGKASI
ncbi:hypothetical protein LR948_10605 [Roseivivax sp. GX 12232]|uniref:alpha/beta hydrolase family esterase n=1 Tax=Roseivivax sp. GX 12232 TaxID=2900547 RepID=UPI001E3F1679|nr:hypothetical protein [Roseivivax sp. GX 12232]MCE0505808.1 hypothetical protein [Roseivivax sp. GX 12232]